ncbi:hypothetical protein ACQR3P_29180 [Rhodococcus sp. IEGM1300]
MIVFFQSEHHYQEWMDGAVVTVTTEPVPYYFKKVTISRLEIQSFKASDMTLRIRKQH